ncbi:cAMP-binding domain of CRP or a regulatory subunit of cAMP-dependent protein kinases [Peptoclostridium litorale DSM 5388]|uniref:cAMP-binding protein n=1 Tax=Peptoclostridium litorale DSM 5388 TaxID=1121324 RepID=A0A069RI78_PEPLI|nr:Crp/Fnr family transcriptional regulator [Peptoclostridium litorale]KDR96706.1 cAMP-binding protein [Peptoclostridium litorale DSM 5388]SIN67554.1 cAMP-binding domain of CRP or a regulatory subunit of cAMP-dependent protein kinases [Peptoclostridium litorale DSM 5388]
MMESAPIPSVKAIDLFPDSIVTEWTIAGKEISFEKGALISTHRISTEIALIIKSGIANAYQLHVDGKECILGLVSPGEFTDVFNIFDSKESDVLCRALTDVTVTAVPKKRIKEAVKQNTNLATELLGYFSKQYKDVINILSHVAYGKVEERLIFLMEKLADPYSADSNWQPIPSVITHKDIAGMIASTRETVTALIGKLINSGILRQHENRLWIRVK